MFYGIVFEYIFEPCRQSRADYHRQQMAMFEAAAAQFPDYDQSTYHS